MCGIGGAVAREGDGALATFTRACLTENARRGPDHRDEREEAVGGWRIGLAHNRLAILDLTPSGNQPKDGEGRITCITYNGEIYNYRELRDELTALGRRFRSSSDTEVLLAAYAEWGDACFARLNGMFALGLLDRGRRRLVLVRDRFGVKPIYYHVSPTRCLFASTPRPIAEVVGREPDAVFLARGARFGVFDDNSSRSQYRAVQAVRPGHFLVVPLDQDTLRATEQPFYSLAERVAERMAGFQPSAARAIEECSALLGDAIALRFRADVPVAISLSGGVDSATVAALACESRQGERLVGFCYGHPERPETEGPVVARIAARLGMGVEYVWPGAEAMVASFWDTLEAQDAPFASGSTVAHYALMRAVHRSGVKVLLGGQGGDEIFMGYRKYLAWRWLAAARRGALAETMRSGSDLTRALWAQRGQWRTYLRASRHHARDGAGDSLLRDTEVPPSPYRLPPGLGLSGRQVADMTTGGLPTLLRYEDRVSMANSVESRLPYLDYRLAEWAIAAPVSLKLRDGYGKWILRRVAASRLPREVVEDRAKRGFDVRVEEWMAAGLGRQIRDDLATHWSWIRDYFAPAIRVDESFSDRALLGSPRRFSDAIAALWIGRCLR